VSVQFGIARDPSSPARQAVTRLFIQQPLPSLQFSLWWKVPEARFCVRRFAVVFYFLLCRPNLQP
jgi:hypothetical protein